ncbi:hypothetical protein GCM10027068_01930 [Prescottella soli]
MRPACSKTFAFQPGAMDGADAADCAGEAPGADVAAAAAFAEVLAAEALVEVVVVALLPPSLLQPARAMSATPTTAAVRTRDVGLSRKILISPKPPESPLSDASNVVSGFGIGQRDLRGAPDGYAPRPSRHRRTSPASSIAAARAAVTSADGTGSTTSK